MMKKIAGIPLLYEPGTRWSYSVAVDIQGYIVQKLSGQKFGDYLKAHVTGPHRHERTPPSSSSADPNRASPTSITGITTRTSSS